jgi:hypothetical protein
MKKILLLTIFFFITSNVLAAEKTKIKDPQTNQLMFKMLAELSLLKTYFVSQEKFADPKNSKIISDSLKEFTNLAKQARHNPDLLKENYKFSSEVLEEHIAETARLFKSGNKSFARWQLASTVSVCMSCHTQIPTKNRTFVDFNNYKMFTSTFDQAEFLFASRAFDQAFFLYDLIIDGYPKNHITLDQVETALDRQLTYYSRIKRNPTEAIAKIKLHQKNKEFPEFLQTNFKIWITQFEKWKNQTMPDPKKATDKEILEFAKKNIDTKWTSAVLQASNPDLIPYLRVSGILYEYLQLHPKSDATPNILYWLAICDRSINHNFFYSLADLYLKECIVKYPTSPIALSCYKEYELETIASYTGSAGTFLPPEVRSELNQMKKLLENNVKLNIH